MQEAHSKWIKSPDNLRLSVPYIKAEILHRINGHLHCQLQTERGLVQVEVPSSSVFEVSDQRDYSDMCDMNVLNEPEVLNNILRRYKNDDIFTNIGPTLIVVNPYKKIDRLFSSEILAEIREKVLLDKIEKDKPHVYQIAGRAFLSLKETDSKQAIVISGESGAGKTESTKYCMQLLTSLCQKKNHSIQQKILACNPILQAFGNSKTVRNENSSRFGKYVKIYFNAQNSIQGAHISSYLLQKSRVVSISPNERSFHSFYAFTASNRYNAKQASHYAFLRQSGCYVSSHIDDVKYFSEINQSFRAIGFEEKDIDKIWQLVGTILELGNIDFDESNHIVDQSQPCQLTHIKTLYQIANSLQIQIELLQKLLLFERKKFLKEFTLSPFSLMACRSNRNTLCRALYNAVFQFILFKIELTLAPVNLNLYSFREINILDIFGFQNFEQNNFQQLCINFTNEKLLKLYNTYVFDREMEILKQDGLQKQILGILPPLNDQIISLINGKLSIFSIINDMTLPQFRDNDMMQGFKKIESHLLKLDQIDKTKFRILHSQCPVLYSITGFKLKNQDKINEEILVVVKRLFDNHKTQGGKTILSKFSKEIDDLTAELSSSAVHFIRCIKPNELKQPHHPDQSYILTQIRYLGIFQTILIRRNTFPFRKYYKDFRRQFIMMFPHLKRETDEKEVSKQILKSLSKKEGEFLLGNCRVYVSAELEQALNNQIYKFLKMRNEKLRKIQLAFKKCIYRNKILKNLHLMAQRIQIFRKIPGRLELKMKVSGFSHMKSKYKQQKHQEQRQKECEKLQKQKQAKRVKRQLQQSQRKKKEIFVSSQNFLERLQKTIEKQKNRNLRQALHIIRSEDLNQPFISQKQSKLSIDIQSPMSLYNQLNSTELVGNSVIDSYAHYRKQQTPSNELFGKSQVFDSDAMLMMSENYATKKHLNASLLFEGNIYIEPEEKMQKNPNLQRLKNILSERYKVQIMGSEEDFFSPNSSHCTFQLSQLPTATLNEIIDFQTEQYFHKTLRKRTNFIGSKKSYQEILVYKKGALSKSMTILPTQEQEQRSSHIFNYLLKIGDELKIQNVLKCVELFIDQCQNSSADFKSEVMTQLLRQSNTSNQLSAIRIYQTMAVFLHVYNPDKDLLWATLNMFYWKMQNKKLGSSEAEYLRYVFSIILQKVKKRSVIGYLPISYQIMGLMCKRQISIPVYLPTGNSILVRVESYNTFAEIKSSCMIEFGINRKRFKEEYFTFFEVVNFDNEQLEETPIKQTNMVWDMMTYWELTKNKYVESGIKPPNFFLMFKIRYIFQCRESDEECIQLYFSQLYFDYFMGRIVLADSYMYSLAALIKLIKYEDKPTKDILFGLLPLAFVRRIKKERANIEINSLYEQLKKGKTSMIDAKFKFVQICEFCELALAMNIPTEENEEKFQLYLKNRAIVLVDEEQHLEVISLKRLVKWSIQKQHFVFEVATPESEVNTTFRIKTDHSSICNQFLKNIPLLKSKGDPPSFRKK